MDFIDEKIQIYSEQHTTPETEVLQKLSRQTYVNVMNPRMLSGHLQGRFLSMLSKMIRPQNILEIGTFTGYSAICLAEGLQDGGKLITIDINPELENMVSSFVEQAGLRDSIQHIIGDAYQIIRTLDVKFDLVFIDADKESYARYFDLVFDKLNTGGFIIADNVLWSGKVFDKKQLEKDPETKAIDEFNKKIMADSRVESMLLPVRDGLMVVRKK